MLMMERYISIYRNLLAKSILTIDYSNPPSPSELLPPCEPLPESELPPEGVCEPPEVDPPSEPPPDGLSGEVRSTVVWPALMALRTAA